MSYRQIANMSGVEPSDEQFEMREVGPNGDSEWGVLPDDLRPANMLAFRSTTTSIVSAIIHPEDLPTQFELIESN